MFCELTGKHFVSQFVWTGPTAALYRSFDHSDGLILMEEDVKIHEVSLVTGKVMVQIIGFKHRSKLKYCSAQL